MNTVLPSSHLVFDFAPSSHLVLPSSHLVFCPTFRIPAPAGGVTKLGAPGAGSNHNAKSHNAESHNAEKCHHNAENFFGIMAFRHYGFSAL